MTVCQAYRLHQAILSIPSGETDSQIPATVPSGAVVTKTHSAIDGLRTVDVIWGYEAVTMFAADLRARATLIDLLSESFSEPYKSPRSASEAPFCTETSRSSA
jgi:hypothetical protein